MTRKPIRTKVAVVSTAAGLAVLLAGPMNTFGLGVPGGGDTGSATTQVTSTVEGAVQTTQQTVVTTVTNVESTVQATVQTTTQAAAPAPTQTSVPSATKTVAAPVKKKLAAVSHPRTQAKPAAAPVQLVKKARGASSSAPVAAVVKRAHIARTRHAASATSTSSEQAQDGPVSCDVPALALLPGGSQLQGLLTLVCDATGLGSRLGVPASPVTPVDGRGDVRGASARGAANGALARLASLALHPTAVAGASQPGGTPGGSALAIPIGGPTGAAVYGTHGGGDAYGGGIPMAHISPGAGAGTDVAKSSARHGHHHAFFAGQSRGTEILMAILFANLAILGGIVLWRLAVRWVIPRFA